MVIYLLNAAHLKFLEWVGLAGGHFHVLIPHGWHLSQSCIWGRCSGRIMLMMHMHACNEDVSPPSPPTGTSTPPSLNTRTFTRTPSPQLDSLTSATQRLRPTMKRDRNEFWKCGTLHRERPDQLSEGQNMSSGASRTDASWTEDGQQTQNSVKATRFPALCTIMNVRKKEQSCYLDD